MRHNSEMSLYLQLSKDLKGVTKEQMKRVTIAYEPVWAIGTGLTCDANIAQVPDTFCYNMCACQEGGRLDIFPTRIDSVLCQLWKEKLEAGG